MDKEIVGKARFLNRLHSRLFAGTPIIMTGEKLTPPRTVGFWGSAMLQINGMIGAGIFALPAVLVAAVGSFAPWLMILGGLLFLPLALVFAWLATRFDQSGGPVLYGKEAFGTFVGFQAGWCRYASGLVALAANTYVMVAYFAVVFPALGVATTATVAVVASIVLFTLVNVVSMRGSIGMLGGLTLLKMMPLALIVGTAVVGNFASPKLVLPQFGEVQSVVLLLFYAFIGFEGVTVPAGEGRDPKRHIPRVLLTVLTGVTIIYAVVIWAYLAIGPQDVTDDNALAAAAEFALGQWGTLVIVIGAGLSIAGNNFSSLIVVPRMAYGMAQQGMLPAWLEKISPRFLTPANSIILYGALACIFALWGGFAALATASTLTRMLTYGITAAALPVLERREGRLVPLHLVVAVLALAAAIWIASHADATAWMMFAVLIGIGTALYFFAARSKAALQSARA